MADLIFDTFKEFMADGSIDMDNDSFKCALFTDAVLPAAADYSTYAALALAKVEVPNGDGYTTTGELLANVVWVGTAGTVKFDADSPVWTVATFTARYAVIYSSIGDELVCLIDFGGDKSVANGTFTVDFNAAGILTLS